MYLSCIYAFLLCIYVSIMHVYMYGNQCTYTLRLVLHKLAFVNQRFLHLKKKRFLVTLLKRYTFVLLFLIIHGRLYKAWWLNEAIAFSRSRLALCGRQIKRFTSILASQRPAQGPASWEINTWLLEVTAELELCTHEMYGHQQETSVLSNILPDKVYNVLEIKERTPRVYGLKFIP